MRKIPTKLREEMSNDPYYKKCCLAGDCGGRITWEHVIIFQGRQLNKRFAIIPLCEKHHAVNTYQDAGTMDKELNEWVALNRATDIELQEISKVIDYKFKREYLNNKYGEYNE